MAFDDEVEAWVVQLQGLIEDTFRHAGELLVEEMTKPRGVGGNMPVDTGFLRSSLQASLTEMPAVDPKAVPAPGGSYHPTAATGAVFAAAQLGDTVYLGFTAAYAARQNYGFTGTDSLGRHYAQSGHLFVEKAAQNWPQLVDQAAVAMGWGGDFGEAGTTVMKPPA